LTRSVSRHRDRLVPAWPRASLRTYLAAIMLIATLPVVVLMVVQIYRDSAEREQRMWRELERSASATARNVERELASSIDALTILARTTLVATNDSTELERLLRQTPRLRPTWGGMFLVDAAGRMRHDSSLPPGVAPGALPEAARNDAELARLRNAPLPVVSNLMRRGPDARATTAIAVPVHEQGQLRYVVGAWIDLPTWQELLQKSAPPAEGFLELVDRDRLVIARTQAPERYVGRPLPAAASAAMVRQPVGAGRTQTLDGGTSYTAWHAVEATGWAMTVGVPVAALDAALRHAIVTTLVGAALCVVLGLYFAFLAARHLVEPLQQLAADEPPGEATRIAVREVAALSESLRAAYARDMAARQRLQATADEFETLFNGSPTGLAFAHDPECRVVTRNPAMDQLFGAEADVPAQSVQVLHRGERLAPERQPLQLAAASGDVVPPQELELVVPGRPRRHVLAQAVPLLDADDRPRGAIAAFVDITDRVRAEARLRDSQDLVDLAQEAGRVGFFRYHVRDDVLHWTDGQASLFGLAADSAARRAGSTLRDWSRHIAREDRLRVERAMRRMFAAGQARDTLEYRIEMADGSTRWLSSRVLVIYGADRRPQQVVGVSVDATDEKLAQRERARLTAAERTARIEAEAANRAKDEFLAMLGHELRNPLSAIAAAIEVLNRVPADAEVAINARNIAARQTRHLAHMMDDLLDVGRVISGKVLLVRRTIDLAAIARRVASTLEVTGEARHHSFTLDLHEAWVDGDATRIEQVLANLVTNAVKYTPAGSEVTLSVGVEGSDAVLRVRDNGAGIPPALLPRIFDLFVQGERALDRRAGGLGVGLTLVRRLVELHGGTIRAESSERGSLFEVRLPAVAAPTFASGGAPRAEQPGRRVVLVDDNVDALEGLRVALELDGHTVVAAVDGPGGLQAVLDVRPDAAIVDIGLPGMTGLEVAQRSRAAGYAGLMIALSGYGRSTDVQQAFAAGFDTHLVKPVDTVELQRLLANA
jgi:signal transduction histidine kinase/CheY-like chemotaxis protein